MSKIKNLIFKEQISPPQYQQDQMRGDFATQVPQDNSLDMKVDRYLVRYEREAIPSQSVYEGVIFERTRLQKLAGILKEQDAPAPEEPEEDAPAEDAPADAPAGDAGLDFDLSSGGGDAPTGGDTGGDAQAPQAAMRTPRLDIAKFAGAVARLVENYDQLLDPKTTILNRARTYILNNYNEAMAKQLMTILQSNYNLSPEMPETPEAPLAVGAVPTGGG